MLRSLTPVVAGVDGSAVSLAAAAWAAHEARLRGVRLHLLSAWGSSGRAEPGALDATARGQWARDSLRLAVDRIRSRYPSLDIGTRAAPDRPRPALLRSGAGTQLLVLGSYGLGGRAAGTPGSTSLRIAASAPFPVTLVPSADAATAPGPVVLALDAADPADEVIAFACETAERRQVPLLALYAWTVPGPAARYPALRQPGLADGARHAARRLAEAMLPWREKWPEVPVTEAPVPGSTATAVADHSSDAGLVVLGHRTTRPRLSPAARTVIQRATCPVAVVPHP